MPNRNRPPLTTTQTKYIRTYAATVPLHEIAKELSEPYYKLWRYCTKHGIEWVMVRHERVNEWH